MNGEVREGRFEGEVREDGALIDAPVSRSAKVTTFYIDTEFTGYHGRLISIALVGTDGEEFYEVIHVGDVNNEWVEENVLPRLGKDAIPYGSAQACLWHFLSKYGNDCHVIADWPEDLAFFMKLLCKPNGVQLDRTYTMELIDTTGVDLGSKVPHNALEDARALHKWHQREIARRLGRRA